MPNSRYFIAERAVRQGLESSASDVWCWGFRAGPPKTHSGFGRRHLNFVSLMISSSGTKTGGEGSFLAGSAEGVRDARSPLQPSEDTPLVSWENSLCACFLPDHQSPTSLCSHCYSTKWIVRLWSLFFIQKCCLFSRGSLSLQAEGSWWKQVLSRTFSPSP